LDHSTISVTSNDTEAPKLANIKPNSPSTAHAEEKHGDEIDQEGAYDFPSEGILLRKLTRKTFAGSVRTQINLELLS